MEKNLAIGVDIGGSHITCAAVDLRSWKILRNTIVEEAVDNQAAAATIISVWTEAISSSLEKVSPESVKGIGFAMPSPFDYVKGICYIRGVAKYENLYGISISDAISGKLAMYGNFLVRFINDASAFAVGEAIAGSAKNHSRSVSVTFGTGFGSAFIADKIPVVDGIDVPEKGCVFHIPFREGIADDYFSTRWFVNSYAKATGKMIAGVKDLAELAVSDALAMELFHDFGNDAAAFLAPWLKKFRAEILVIGGNISHSYYLFGKAFEEKLNELNWHGIVAISGLKEDAALLGSAYLLDESFWRSVQHALPLM